MKNIKDLKIRGLKKFEYLNVSFNEHMNILVGENEAGKSTILEAINIVLNQKYHNADKAVLKDLFNIEQVKRFLESPSVDLLPKIIIEVSFNLDPKAANSEYFYGEVNIDEAEKYGITFKCEFDKELGSLVENDIDNGVIPYEYYNLSWKTFGGFPYKMIKRPLEFLTIDTSDSNGNNTFNYFNRNLFNSRYDDQIKLGIKHDLRTKLNNIFDDLELEELDENRKFGINDKKFVLESILSIYEEGIPLENKGKGMESLIKTKIALDKPNSKIELILMEEPENHLSYTNMLNMISEIDNKQNESQIILTTHSDLIASRLNLENILWIRDNDVISLKGIDEEDDDKKKVSIFFTKSDNSNILKMILSEKIILVEGPTENLLIPKFYKEMRGKSIEDDKVSIISCNGISYKNYLKIAKKTNKKVAVITDNDKKQRNIDMMENFNEKEKLQHIFMDSDVTNWTWEACFYNLNKEFFEKFIKVQKNRKYLFHGDPYDKVLGKMLNNKVETAYDMLISSDVDVEIPQYIKDAILWINE